MKKLVIIACLAAAVINIQCKKEQKADKSFGIVNLVTGTVTIDSNGSKKAAAPGDKITSGMKMITGDKSFADIYFGENVVRITDNSELVISQYLKDSSDGSEKTVLKLNNGTAYSKVVKKLAKKDVYDIGTPTAIAGVRGTEFVISEQKGKSNIACLDGKVMVKEAGKPDTSFVALEKGQEVDVEAGKQFSVRELKEENLNNMRKVLEDIQELKQEIRAKFEEQKAEIKQKLEDQKEANRQMMQDQKDKNRENIQGQKDKDKDNITNIKEDFKNKKEEIKPDIKDINKPDLNSVKPEIKKPEIK